MRHECIVRASAKREGTYFFAGVVALIFRQGSDPRIAGVDTRNSQKERTKVNEIINKLGKLRNAVVR